MSRTGKIRLDVNQEIQEVTEYLDQEMAGVKFSAPVVSNRSVNTTVTIPDGQTLLIGGLISKRTSDQVKGIPILKDLPVIGALFRDKSTDEQKTSIFISLTPKVVNLDESVERQDSALRPYLEDLGEAGSQHYEDRDTLNPLPPAPRLSPNQAGLEITPADPKAEKMEPTPEGAKVEEPTSPEKAATTPTVPPQVKDDPPAAPPKHNSRRHLRSAKRGVFEGLDQSQATYTNSARPSESERWRTAQVETEGPVPAPAPVVVAPAP